MDHETNSFFTASTRLRITFYKREPVIKAVIVITGSMLLKMQGCVPFKVPEKVKEVGCCYFLSSSLSTIFLYAS